jgi:two-component system NtrC family sensor kinase
MRAGDIDRVEWALRERVKELTCLYGIARVTQKRSRSLDAALQQIVELLPPAWQYPEIACAQIVLDEKVFSSGVFAETIHRQSAELKVGERRRGSVEVGYTRFIMAGDDSPFLSEEQSLIEMVAREIAIHIERHESDEQRAKLQEQLRHADRLATLGQLAAGVAHEINEPLANILGFAQLAKKAPRLPKQAGDDMDKIVRNCLHARGIIQKLLTFARQMPPERARIDLNSIVRDGLYFLESRCAKASIEVKRELCEDLPEISADASQLHQVLVNLVVNAIQAMPEGGVVTIGTSVEDDMVILTVADTGCGMTDDVKERVFTPFFTTKDINEGTGLGLAVVHGIVASHGGNISLESTPGHGTRFEVRLPVNPPSAESEP